MIAALSTRLAATPRGRVAVLGALAIVLAAVAIAPGGLAAAAARAGLAAGAIGAAAILVRRRRGGAGAACPVVAVVARVPLGKNSGVAVVELEGRRVLLGFGRDGVSLLADGPAPSGRSAP